MSTASFTRDIVLSAKGGDKLRELLGESELDYSCIQVITKKRLDTMEDVEYIYFDLNAEEQGFRYRDGISYGGFSNPKYKRYIDKKHNIYYRCQRLDEFEFDHKLVLNFSEKKGIPMPWLYSPKVQISGGVHALYAYIGYEYKTKKYKE